MNNRLYKHTEEENYFGFSLVTKLATEYKCNGNQITLYMAICDVLMKDPEANAIPIEYLRNVTGFNKSTVPLLANALVEKGLIERWIPDGFIGRTTHYKVNWIEGATL